jgi:hypothetical protein
MPYDDPIVEDVRNSREKLFKKFDFDLKKFLKHIREEDKKHPESIAKDIKPIKKLPDFLKPL